MYLCSQQDHSVQADRLTHKRTFHLLAKQFKFLKIIFSQEGKFGTSALNPGAGFLRIFTVRLG